MSKSFQQLQEEYDSMLPDDEPCEDEELDEDDDFDYDDDYDDSRADECAFERS